MLVEDGVDLRRASCSSGARSSIAMPSGQPRARPRGRAPRAPRAARARRDRPRDRPAAVVARVAAHPRVQRAQPHAGGAAASSTTAAALAREYRTARGLASVTRRRDAAGDRRRRTGLQRDDQSADRDRRRHRAGVARRRARGRSRVRAVSSDGARRARARRGFCCRRRCAARAPGWSTHEGERFMPRYERAGELASRDLVSRAIVREVARTRTARLPVAAASRSGLGTRPLSDDRRRRADPRVSISRAIRSRSVRRRTTSWAASKPTCGGARRCPGLCRRRGRMHRRARRQPAREQLAARRARLRRARGDARCWARRGAGAMADVSDCSNRRPPVARDGFGRQRT